MFVGAKAKVPRHAFDGRQALRDMWAAKWDLGLPVLVIAAVVSGFATIVEAAGIAAAYALLVELVVFREINPVKQLPRVMADAATLVGAVLILLGVALGLTSYLVDAQIPQALLGLGAAPTSTRRRCSCWRSTCCCWCSARCSRSTRPSSCWRRWWCPWAGPSRSTRVHLGVVFLANLELGFLFPPMGLNLFLSAQRFNKPLPMLYRRALPFLVILAVGVLFITYVPAVTTGVSNLMPQHGAAH